MGFGMPRCMFVDYFWLPLSGELAREAELRGRQLVNEYLTRWKYRVGAVWVCGLAIRLYDYTAAQSAYKICSMPMRYGVSPICS